MADIETNRIRQAWENFHVWLNKRNFLIMRARLHKEVEDLEDPEYMKQLRKGERQIVAAGAEYPPKKGKKS